MRRVWMALLLLGLALPAMASKLVSVREFEEVMEASKHLSDGAMARKISGMELTERIGASRLAALNAAMPGKHSQESLMRLADLAAFLNPPAMVNQEAPPSIADQNKMFSQVISYATEMFPRLPNFFATRDGLQFMELKPMETNGAEKDAIYDRLHVIGSASDTLLYRGGKEVVDSGPTKRKHSETGAGAGLRTYGLFGPIIGTVLSDASHGRLAWNRWEAGKDGPLAVFEFSVPRELSHYEVTFCCFPTMSGAQKEFKQYSAYHGEIAVDPMSGAILRLAIKADMQALDPVRKSQIVVDYEPVMIGGSLFVCPTRSVSMLVAYKQNSNIQETTMTDAWYSDYHRFGTESTIITDLPEDPH